LHYTSSNPKARQLHSLVVNAGVDASVEDNFGHTAQESILPNFISAENFSDKLSY
jgi:hypothetical protein